MDDEGAGSDGDDGAVDVDATSTNQTEISLGLLKVSDVRSRKCIFLWSRKTV